MNTKDFAKKTFVALKNPYQTVVKTNTKAINSVDDDSFYIGIKSTEAIPMSLVEQLGTIGGVFHTIDEMAYGGRAIDLRFLHPLTTMVMSGSSSGTALNVFYHINDLGIGTDGGGSVLAPAASLNLFSCISGRIEEDHMMKYEKKSTDGLGFTPSIGYMTRTFDLLNEALKIQNIRGAKADRNIELLMNSNDLNSDLYKKYKEELNEKCIGYELKTIEGLDKEAPREVAIKYLKEHIRDNKVMISLEGPIQTEGIGDSLFGQFDEVTKLSQINANKGFLRVVNMCNFFALTIPMRDLACAYTFICEDTEENVSAVMELAERFVEEPNKMVERYFSNLDMYL